MIDDFTFDLIRADRKEDKFHYIVSAEEDFNMMVCIIGIDTNKHVGPFSNIDFVHFIWENFLRFIYKEISNGSLTLRLV